MGLGGLRSALALSVCAAACSQGADGRSPLVWTPGLPQVGASAPVGSLVGRWDVSGTDARGPYQGELEVRPEPDGQLRFARVVRYPGLVVRGDRELWWAWQ